MEAHLVAEFITRTGANPIDAHSCLKTWEWDLKRAITDYSDASTHLLSDVSTNTPLSLPATPPTHAPAANESSLYRLKTFDIGDASGGVAPLELGKRLTRGISRATDNVTLVSRARSEFELDFEGSNIPFVENLQSLETPDYTFTLPNISIYSEAFRKFLEKDLIECSTLSSLEQVGRLNWWVDFGICRKLWPLSTTGDGNCLLHAASLGMWGFHDRKLTLRAALYETLAHGEYKEALLRRWRFQQTRFNKQAGFVYSEDEWSKEWSDIVAMASTEPRNSTKSARRSILLENCVDKTTYESLEEIHILALAHVLRRTIIVIADTVLRDMNGEAMAPIPFGGVYLPFEVSAEKCHRGPLLLTYDMAHFSALVAMETTNNTPPALIPFTDCDNKLLPIQFCIDPGSDFDWKNYDGIEGIWALSDREHIALLREYLDIIYASPLDSPDDEIYDDLTDDEIERKFNEAEIGFNNNNNNNNNNGGDCTGSSGIAGGGSKNKAAKQMQSVVKQFGSIGKSMSKKIKKNIGSITKMGGSKGKKEANTLTGAFGGKQRVLCAKLKAKRHEYQEKMIANYLECAQQRFHEIHKGLVDVDELEFKPNKLVTQTEVDVVDGGITSCINTDCPNFATSSTSYLCADCFEQQRQRETGCTFAPLRYGTGNSKFYTAADTRSHTTIQRLPSVKRLNELDQTLYLSNSTFYNDQLPSYKDSFRSSGAVVSPFAVVRDHPIFLEGESNNYRVSSAPSYQTPIGSAAVVSNKPLVRLNSEPRRRSQECHRGSGSSGNSSGGGIDESVPVRCSNRDCAFYGNCNNNFYCPKCCKDFRSS